MFSNYLKIAVRTFFKQKYYSLINTIGLALGIAACILIVLFVEDELSYESGFKNNQKIYRLVEDFPMGPHLSRSATVPFPTKNSLMTDFPEVTNAALMYRPASWGQTPILKLEDQEFLEDDFVFAEHSFLEIYHFHFLKGDPSNALVGPNRLVLTASAAKKYFGDENPIGKRLNLNSFVDLEVAGVIEDLPDNTHLKFDMLASFDTFKSFFANNPTFFETQWVWVAAWMYFTVDSEQDVEKIRAQLPTFVKSHFPETLKDAGLVLDIQKVNDVHLTSDRELEFEQNGNIRNVYIFSFIAILILLIAVINFMNLATSRSTKRAKEVGLRKVFGAQKPMLISQFMSEAVFTSMLSMIISVGFIYLAMPWFNQLTGKNISIDLFSNYKLAGGLLLLGTIVGLLAGSYPALALSAFKPTETVKGKLAGGHKNFLRRALVVSQFVISISLIICIGIVYKQLNYVHNKDLGFNKDQILTVDFGFNLFNKYSYFKSELLKIPEVQSVTRLGGSIPGKEGVIENAFVQHGQPASQQQWFSVIFASHDFEKVFDVEFLQGHSFRAGNSTDSTGYIINESAAKAMGWGDDVVGRQLDQVPNGTIQGTGTVIGLVKDFHYQPLYVPIKPLVIGLGGNVLMMKLRSEDLSKTVASIEDVWNKQFEGNPFRFAFMDDNFDKLYSKEDKFSTTIQYFSVLAIFIACLGLLGLSSYSTENRKKEIGIRKVNGATTFELIVLLTRDFSMLVLIAYALAIPIAYYFGSLWLNNFAYKITIGLPIYVVAGVVSLTLAVVTVSYHTIRASRTNPVNSLRYE